MYNIKHKKVKPSVPSHGQISPMKEFKEVLLISLELQTIKMKTKGLEIEGNSAKVTIYGGGLEKVRSLPTVLGKQDYT